MMDESSPRASLLLGVDGGGTKTDACIGRCDSSGKLHILGRGRAGPSNPCAAGLGPACDAIAAAITRALDASQVQAEQMEATCLAIAGAARENEQQSIGKFLAEFGVRGRLRFVHDGWAVLAAGSSQLIGISLIAGTGSLAFGRNAEGLTARAGGWGHLIGDEGSGYQMALAACRIIAHHEDGRAPETLLKSLFFERLQIESFDQFIRYIYGETRPRQSLAELAPCVFAAYRAHDGAAISIVHDAADALAEMVRALVRQLNLPPRFELALSGGVLVHEPLLRSRLEDSLRRDGYDPLMMVVHEPVLGSLKLAAGELGS